jgi:cytochrome P450
MQYFDLGTTVMPNLWACHMDVNYFTDPHTFRPDRFLNTDGSLRSHVDGFVPFSIGKRQCVGDQFSKVCMFQLITSIIWQYRLRFDEYEPMPSLQPRFGLILDPEKYRIIFEKRQHIIDNASC